MSINFASDYTEGCHPLVLKALCETNLQQMTGYGTDAATASAIQKIRAAIGKPEADVRFLGGGTQTNQVVIDACLRSYEGVVAVETGHVAVHEAGAIEFGGHKVLTLPAHLGKLDVGELRRYLEAFYADGNHEQMVFPGMVYISHPTEYGTLYSKQELTDISAVCRAYHIPLYLDGARLGYGLMSRETDVTLPELAELVDVFYIGGTKVGALCGEAVVFPKGDAPQHFMAIIKQHGALLAKGRLCGVQFDALFTDDLYFNISKHAIEQAEKLKRIFLRQGIRFFLDSPTNQQFVILPNDTLERLKEQVVFSYWEPYGETEAVVRFCTSWATTDAQLEQLEQLLRIR